MVVKVCKTCGKVLRPTDVFCVNCGTREPVPQPTPTPKADKQVAFCPECGNRIRPKWLFCMECGTRIKGSQSQGDGVPSHRPGNSERPVSAEWTGMQAASPVAAPPAPQPLAADRQSQAQAPVPMGGNDYLQNIHHQTVTIDSALGNGATSSSLFPDDFGSGAHPGTQSAATQSTYIPFATHTLRMNDLNIMSTDDAVDASGVGLDSWGDSFYEWEKTDAGFPADDAPTTVYDEDDDNDALTMVYADEEEARPQCMLTRTSTGDKLGFDSLPVTLGRGSAADVRIAGNPYIGRVHMRLLERDGEFYIEDLRSSNHTYLNGVQLLPEEPTMIQDGDTISLAREEFTVSIA